MGVDAKTRLLRELEAHIHDRRVRWALSAVPREAFVPPGLRDAAYDNRPLPIGQGQTISQPLVVGRMLDVLELRPTDRVLDVGTGSGWHAALLAALTQHVWTIERHAELAAEAERRFAELGITNISTFVGDGTLGVPSGAPYDAINVAAAASDRLPRALVDQLAVGGRIIAPVGGDGQRLIHVRRIADDEYEQRELEPVRFVPLVSEG